MIDFLNYLADEYYQSILKKKIEEILGIYNLDKKFEIKNKKFKLYIKKRKYSKEMFYCILYLENYDVLFYICNFEILKNEIIRKIEDYLKGDK